MPKSVENRVPLAKGVTPAFSVRTWPFYWLIRATNGYLGNIEDLLDGTGLDVPRWRVLMTLREERWLSVSDIAVHSNTKLSTMTKTVQRMQADGLVACRESKADRRVTEVDLTATGIVASDVARDAAMHVFERAFRGMSDREVGQLNSLMKQVADNLR